MPSKLQHALALVKSNKHKKAHLLLKKINQKKDQINSNSLFLEGICLAKENKHKLAEIKLLQSLDISDKQTNQVDVYNSLVKVALSQKENRKAVQYLTELFKIDNPQKALIYSEKICALSFDLQDYKEVINYAEKLTSSSSNKQTTIGYIFLTLSFAIIKDELNSQISFEKLLPEIDKLEKNVMIFFLANLKSLKLNQMIDSLLNQLKENFEHQQWYINEVESKNFTKSTNENSSIPSLSKDIVVCEDPKTAILINNFISQLKKMGAVFHNQLRFYEQNGELSIKSFTKQDNNEVKMQVPLKCMPMLCDYKFSIEDNYKLNFESKKHKINPSAVPIMKMMIDLYNSTDKIKRWNKVYPLLALKDCPTIINELINYRPLGQKLSKYKKLFDEKKWNELLINSFLGSREFAYPKEVLSSAQIKTKKSFEKGLLAIIDFLNHKMGEESYLTDKKNALVAITAKPNNITNELFVQYGILDPVLTYLTYGFVDKNAPILFSGAMQFNLLTGIRLNIISTSANYRNNIESVDSNHLGFYLPSGIKREQNNIYITDLIIPSNHAKNTLKQVIRKFLKECDHEGHYNNLDLLNNEIVHVEKIICHGNVTFWNNFQKIVQKQIIEKKLNDTVVQNDLLELAEHCQSFISSYLSSQESL